MKLLEKISATVQPRRTERSVILTPAAANRPLLTAGKPETRQYKAVFFLGKAEIGLPSAVVIAIAVP